MAREGFDQFKQGVGQLGSAFKFAASGADSNRDQMPPEQAAAVREQNSQSTRDLVGGLGNITLGGLGYVTSPINAALRTYAGEPVERATGIPKEYTELAASFAVPSALGKLGEAFRAVKPAATRPAPSVEQIKATIKPGYESPDITGFKVKPQAVQNWSFDTRTDLTAAGLDDTTAGKTWRILSKIDTAPEGATVTGQNLDSLRKTLGNVAKEIDPVSRRATPDAAAASRAMDSLDKLIPGISRADVLAGDAGKAAAALSEVRANNSAASHAELIDQKVFRAELRAAAANSGQNVGNTMRQRIADILLNPRERRGYSQGELALMQHIVEGGPMQHIVGPMAAIPAIGFGLKKLSNFLTARDIGKLNEMIRANSPLGRQVGAPLQDWSRAAQAAQGNPNARNIAILTVASRNLSNNLRDTGIAVTPENLLRSLQGPVPGRTDQENP